MVLIMTSFWASQGWASNINSMLIRQACYWCSLGGPDLLHTFRTQLPSKPPSSILFELLNHYTSSTGVHFNYKELRRINLSWFRYTPWLWVLPTFMEGAMVFPLNLWSGISRLFGLMDMHIALVCHNHKKHESPNFKKV